MMSSPEDCAVAGPAAFIRLCGRPMICGIQRTLYMASLISTRWFLYCQES
jgi:hypothetical protein